MLVSSCFSKYISGPDKFLVDFHDMASDVGEVSSPGTERERHDEMLFNECELLF